MLCFAQTPKLHVHTNYFLSQLQIFSVRRHICLVKNDKDYNATVLDPSRYVILSQ
jgi:hypothetical protein